MSPVKVIEGTEAILTAIVNLGINVPLKLVTGIDKLLRATVNLVATTTSLPSTIIRDVTSVPFNIVGAAIFPDITGRLGSMAKEIIGPDAIKNTASTLGSAFNAGKAIANTNTLENALSKTYGPAEKTIDNSSDTGPPKAAPPLKDRRRKEKTRQACRYQRSSW